MKERGLSKLRTITRKHNEHLTVPNTHKKEPLPMTISASGHLFHPVEDIPYAGIPKAMLHYYGEVGEQKQNLNVQIIEIGLNDPRRRNEPIPLRIDHGCPCMELQLAGHDCAQQRELSLQAMKKIGRGMMVMVNTESSAGMGHGIFHVMKNQKNYQEARLSGKQQVPTMVEYFRQVGVEAFDVRKHPEVASLIARRLAAVSYDEEQNPIIFLGSSPAKIDSLQNGHNIPIADTARVIVADRTDHSKADLGYGKDAEVSKSGVYVEIQTPEGKNALVLLTELFPYYKKYRQQRRENDEKMKNKKQKRETVVFEAQHA